MNGPRHAPCPAELADTELLLDGALAPLTGFPTRAQAEDWPVALTLRVPASLVEGGGAELVLTDETGTPVAALEVRDVWAASDAANPADAVDATVHVGGPLRRIGARPHRTFRDLRRTPAQVRATLPPGGRVLGLFADRPLHRPQLAQLAYAARTVAGTVLVLIPAAEAGPDGLAPEALIRTVLAARDELGAATVVAVPLAARRAAPGIVGWGADGWRASDEIADALVRGRVAVNYGATHLLADNAHVHGGPRILLPRELAHDGRDGQWRAADDIPPRHRRTALSDAAIQAMLDAGETLPDWHTPPAVAEHLARARPPRTRRGLVVLLTGPDAPALARGVATELAETGERTVTVIEPHTARELGDAAAAVAVEAARHGGLVLWCGPVPSPMPELTRAVGADLLAIGAGLDAPDAPARLTLATDRLPPDESVRIVLHRLGAEGWLNRG